MTHATQWRFRFAVELNNADCDAVLKELEHIDDEAEELDIMLLKINDVKYAKKYGINKVPAIVYFRRKFPSIFRGMFQRFRNVFRNSGSIRHTERILEGLRCRYNSVQMGTLVRSDTLCTHTVISLQYI